MQPHPAYCFLQLIALSNDFEIGFIVEYLEYKKLPNVD
jgi:hypothetical protein